MREAETSSTIRYIDGEGGIERKMQDVSHIPHFSKKTQSAVFTEARKITESFRQGQESKSLGGQRRGVVKDSRQDVNNCSKPNKNGGQTKKEKSKNKTQNLVINRSNKKC